ncbi:MAG: hypothetical protein ACYTF7_08210 [Planctomycetota bacterium]|jgi:hypothetical protein
MSTKSDTPMLRLTGFDGESSAQMVRHRELSRQIERENRVASRAIDDLDEHDARVVFATRVASTLEGGRAAVLRPENRARLRRMAVKMGIRDFDASLIVAIVQDAARRGESYESDRARSMVGLVGGVAARGGRELLWSVIASILLGGVLLLMLVRWASG